MQALFRSLEINSVHRDGRPPGFESETVEETNHRRVHRNGPYAMQLLTKLVEQAVKEQGHQRGTQTSPRYIGMYDDSVQLGRNSAAWQLMQAVADGPGTALADHQRQRPGCGIRSRQELGVLGPYGTAFLGLSVPPEDTEVFLAGHRCQAKVVLRDEAFYYRPSTV